MPKPLIAIVGRPNVGKSTLFNRLARKRIAVVEDLAGTTRDRLYADCDIWGHTCTLIDTGGLDLQEREGYAPAIVEQAQLAIDEADIIIFLTDGREEPTTLDYEVADLLRRTRKPVILAANKVDNPKMAISNLYALRLGEPVSISAVTGMGVAELTEQIEELLPREKEEHEEDKSIKVALVGRPNVGKSAITNRVLGYPRSIVSPMAGTTRDAIDTKLEWKDQQVTLIDTAGMRRKAKVRNEKTAMEYHMVLRALRAVDRSDVVIIVVESGGITDQDTKIAGYAHEAGKAVLVAVNKWDLIEEVKVEGRKLKVEDQNSQDQSPKTQDAKRTLAQKDFERDLVNYLPFISYAPIHYVSAETGYGIEAMFDDALEISKNLHQRVSTGQLNDTIRRAMSAHSVPSHKGKQIKIRYATQAEVSPPKIILFVSHPELLHFSYVRFLENAIRKKFPFRGVPLTIELRKGSGEMTKEERLRAKKEAALEEDRKKYGDPKQKKKPANAPDEVFDDEESDGEFDDDFEMEMEDWEEFDDEDDEDEDEDEK
jgi:GTPase